MWKYVRNPETRRQRVNCARNTSELRSSCPRTARELSLNCVWTPCRLENAGKAEEALRLPFCPERLRKMPLAFLVGPESGVATREQLPEQASGWYVAVNPVALNCDLRPKATDLILDGLGVELQCGGRARCEIKFTAIPGRRSNVLDDFIFVGCLSASPPPARYTRRAKNILFERGSKERSFFATVQTIPRIWRNIWHTAISCQKTLPATQKKSDIAKLGRESLPR